MKLQTYFLRKGTAAVPGRYTFRWLIEIRGNALISAAAVSLLMGIAGATPPLGSRPKIWAQPVKLVGVPNLYRVTADPYRSSQLTSLGMRNLKQLGIKTIINLRSFHSDRDEIGQTALGFEHIYMKTWHPEEEDVVQFLRIVTDPKRTPVLVHCQFGSLPEKSNCSH